VVKRAGDVKDQIPATRVVPVGMPQDMQFAALFGGRRSGAVMMAMSSAMAPPPPPIGLKSKIVGDMDALASGTPRRPSRMHKMQAFVGGFLEAIAPKATGEPGDALETVDVLVSLGAMLEPDGGMPGKNPEVRVANSLAALLFFHEQHNTDTSGSFRIHVTKLLRFLSPERAEQLNEKRQATALRVLELVKAGQSIVGPWEPYARELMKPNELNLTEFWTKLNSVLAMEELRATGE